MNVVQEADHPSMTAALQALLHVVILLIIVLAPEVLLVVTLPIVVQDVIHALEAKTTNEPEKGKYIK
ncbi:hypothetical protein G6F68_020941 [Rhizopus microsporus]|nr:hypothetical protein G6F68_020941 [Rhizopus microsporus]